MKIGTVSTLFPPIAVGGAEIGLKRLLMAMSQSGHQIKVVSTAPAASEETEFAPRCGSQTVRLRNLYWPFDGKEHGTGARALWHAADLFNYPTAGAAMDSLSEFTPDVLFTHNLPGISPAVWMLARRRWPQMPIIHVLHDLSLLCPRATMVDSRGQPCAAPCTTCVAFTAPYAHLSKYVDGVIGVSHDTLERHLNRGYFSRALHTGVIYHGVESVDRSGMQQKVKDSSGQRLVIGFLGRVEQSKGVETLLAALADLSHEFAGKWLCRIAGRSRENYRSTLQSRCEHLPVEFTGYVDAHEFLREIDVLVVPSINPEPYGLVAAEAYSHGVPVIASRTGGLAEIVTEGVTGLQVPVADSAALARALERLLRDPPLRQRLARNAAAAASRYTIDREAFETLEFIETTRRMRLGATESHSARVQAHA